MAATDDAPIYPLYNSTYTAYRVSPLHHGPSAILDEDTLGLHARRLHDTLQGNTLRGVPVSSSAADAAAAAAPRHGRSGALQDCTWELLGDEACWRRLHAEKAGDDNDVSTASVVRVEPETLRGVSVRLRCERATHSALLLRDPDADDFAVDGFTSLPLLLVRMPAPLRDALVEYLSTAFDCRVSPLKLSSAFLSSSMELFLRRLGAKSSSGDSGALDKGVQVQLAFPTVAPALRNLDVSVPRDDIPGFLAHGHALQRSVAACSTSRSGPFTRALEYYMKHHLALDCSHPDVHVSKVVCGPLALSADGKIKLFAPQPLPGSEDGELSPSELATRDFYASLCALAGGETGSLAALARARAAAGLVDGEVAAPKRGEKRVLREVDLNAGTARTSKRRAKSVEEAHVEEAEEMDVLATGSPVAKARLASVPVEPPPPYELHDPRLLV